MFTCLKVCACGIAGICMMKKKVWYTYDDIHRVIKQLAEKIQASGVRYDAMIAIGGGGFIPARILRWRLSSDSRFERCAEQIRRSGLRLS